MELEAAATLILFLKLQFFSMHKVSSIAYFSWRSFNAPTPETEYRRPIFNVVRGRSSIDFWLWRNPKPRTTLKFVPIHPEVH